MGTPIIMGGIWLCFDLATRVQSVSNMPPMTTDSKPKKAGTSYMLFASSVRPQLLEENKKKNNGKANMCEVGKTISELWAKLPGAEKSKFEAQAQKEKEKHLAEMKVWNEANDPLGVLKEKYADL